MKDFAKKTAAILKWIFAKNFGTKVGALVIAFLLWSFVVAEQNPVRDKTFTNIPVTFIGVDVLKERKLTPTVPLSDSLSSITLVAEGNADRIALLTDGMLSAEVNLTGITDVGEKTLLVKAKSTMSGLTMETSPKDVKINIEEVVTRQVPVEVKLTGTKKDWLYYGEPILSYGTISVTGAKSNVERVAKAVCEIDIDKIEEYTKETRTVVLIDNEGNRLPLNLFTGVPSIIVELPIYPQKSVSIDLLNIEQTTTGLAEGYEIVAVSVEPKSIFIAGKLEDINQITSVKLEPITLDDASSDQVVTAMVQEPPGVYKVIPQEVQVQLTILPIEDRRTYSAVDIGIKNLPEQYTAVVTPAAIDVEAIGPKKAVSDLSAADIKPVVDLKDVSVGVHSVMVKFENAPDLGVNLMPSVSAVNVTIRRKNT